MKLHHIRAMGDEELIRTLKTHSWSRRRIAESTIIEDQLRVEGIIRRLRAWQEGRPSVGIMPADLKSVSDSLGRVVRLERKRKPDHAGRA